jgi:hypothetical protein
MMERDLAVSLTMSQIEAAKRLHRELLQWHVTDCALHKLKVQFPGFDNESSLLKVAAINLLYGTKVFAVMRMAEVMHKASTMDDVGLVDKIAELDDRKYVSFASKFDSAGEFGLRALSERDIFFRTILVLTVKCCSYTMDALANGVERSPA